MDAANNAGTLNQKPVNTQILGMGQSIYNESTLWRCVGERNAFPGSGVYDATQCQGAPPWSLRALYQSYVSAVVPGFPVWPGEEVGGSK